MNTYRYTNLTGALKDKQSPLRQHLDTRFPNVSPLQSDYKAKSGQLVVDSGGADAATMGAAFDLAIRFRVAPEHDPKVAWYGVAHNPSMLATVHVVIEAAREAVRAGLEGVDMLGRATWALALTS